jgi:heterotetrameric sarcosine oxidase gamma subunit
MSDFLAVLDNPATTLSIEERPLSGLFQVCAWPVTQQEVSAIVGQLSPEAALDIAPGRYLLESNKDTKDKLLSQLQEQIPATIGSVTDLSDARTCFRVSGDAAALLMAKGLPLDMHSSAFPVGRVIQGAIHEIAVVVRRVEETVFDLYVYHSFAESLSHWLVQAKDNLQSIKD